MARYIDADREIQGFKNSMLKAEHSEATKQILAAIVEYFEKVPTVDVVEVVRCKKCNYYEPHGNGKKGICRHPKLKTYIKHDIDFCSYGERKDT